MDQQLIDLYEKLSFPSALNFRRAAEVAGLSIKLADAKRLAAKYSQRQVTAPANPHNGVITSGKLDARWQADLASYVAQEAKVAGVTYRHVLVVLDVFSRFVWTRKLRNASTSAVSKAFANIIETSGGRAPLEMNVDRGSEFNSSTFREMLNAKGINNTRVAEGRNDIATLDRAIATLKLLITKRTLTPSGGNWAAELKAATASYNDIGHTHLDGETPGSVKDNKQLQFQLQVQSGRDNDTQDKASRKNIEKIIPEGSFRVEEKSKLRGFAKARSFKPKYQQEIRKLAAEQSLSGKYVTDTTGRMTMRSRIKPIPEDSTDINIPTVTQGGSTQRDPNRINATLELAMRIREKLPNNTQLDIAAITKGLTVADKTLMKTYRVGQTRKFLELHTKLFKITGRKAERVGPTPQENIETVKEIRKKSKFGK